MTAFIPMTIQRLAAHVADEADADRRWLLLLEFLEDTNTNRQPFTGTSSRPSRP